MSAIRVSISVTTRINRPMPVTGDITATGTVIGDWARASAATTGGEAVTVATAGARSDGDWGLGGWEHWAITAATWVTRTLITSVLLRTETTTTRSRFRSPTMRRHPITVGTRQMES